MPVLKVAYHSAGWSATGRLRHPTCIIHALARTHLSRGRPNQTLQPTALINEVYLRLIDQSQPIQWQSRSHFPGTAARLMRMILVDHSRARHAAKRGAGLDRR